MPRNVDRCPWCIGDELLENYHDKEWGVPVHEDQKQFEFLVLESAQAGLNWLTVLKKRENYRLAYDAFDVTKVALYSRKNMDALVQNAGIIRNRKKIEASINNAGRFLDIQKEFGAFCSYLWRFVDGTPVVNSWKTISEIPAHTDLSDEISKDLKSRGFSFIGTTIIYAHLQAVGMVNDHIVSCFRYQEIIDGYAK